VVVEEETLALVAQVVAVLVRPIMETPLPEPLILAVVEVLVEQAHQNLAQQVALALSSLPILPSIQI
jgi:hypothetical protein